MSQRSQSVQAKSSQRQSEESGHSKVGRVNSCVRLCTDKLLSDNLRRTYAIRKWTRGKAEGRHSKLVGCL
jgi:hypothetical protein